MVSDCANLLPEVIAIAREAGKIILDFYQNHTYQAFTKQDDTPVTSADLASHRFITEKLQALTPDIPVLSEEDANIKLAERTNWSRYWLIDPLDGTQEFLARSGDFASVIALIENNHPVMGVVYGPVSDVVYYATHGHGAWKMPTPNETIQIQAMHHDTPPSTISMAISRRQDINRITGKMNSAWNYELIPLGSAALKACLVAEGSVDCYLRLGPTGEWDTGATQCIVEEAGGKIVTTQHVPLTYNQRETLINPNFIVVGDPALDWQQILHPEQQE